MLEPTRDPGTKREEIYGARRLLIGRLQLATRGVSRAERAGSLQLFVRAWQELDSANRLGDLVSVLDGRQPENPVPAFLIQLALDAGQEKVTAAVDFSDSHDHLTATDGSGEAGDTPNSKIWWVGNRQEELFPAGFSAQPA